MGKLKWIFTIIILTKSVISISQATKLDSSFSKDGIQTTLFENGQSLINDIALQSDGKIVAVGRTNPGGFDKIAIARYNIDGSLDNSFGDGRKVITSVGKKNDVANSVTIRPDGRIIVAGYTYNGKDNDILLLQYNRDGTLDKSFGKNGIVITAIGFIINLNDKANSLVLQDDGKIVVGGTASGQFCLVRYNSDGSQDQSFNYDGIVSIPVGILDNDGRDIAIQNDGKILIAGPCFVDWNWDYCVLRFTKNGLIDTTFGKYGILVLERTSNSANEELESIAVQADGKIILAGNTGGYHLLMRLLDNGDFDTSFGENGIVDIFFNNDLKSIAIQPDGKIIAVGKTYDYNKHAYNFSWVRYNDKGKPDCSKFTRISAGSDEINSFLIQPDGRILVAGHSNLNFTLARYLGDSLNIKVEEYSPIQSFALFPNPVNTKFTLDYTLEKDDYVTIELWDMLGKKITTYLNQEKQYFGNYNYSLFLPEDIKNGNYIVNFSSQHFQKRIRITKN